MVRVFWGQTAPGGPPWVTDYHSCTHELESDQPRVQSKKLELKPTTATPQATCCRGFVAVLGFRFFATLISKIFAF